MTVTKDQAQMLTTLAVACRPTGARQWNPADVMAEIAKLHDRALPAVTLAVIRAASDKGAERPAVISSGGSHWGDTMLPTAFVPRTLAADARCSVCSHSEVVCRMRWAGDHEFESAAMATKRAAEVDAARAAAAIRAELEPTSGPTERRTLADMAEANPALHERVERLRAENPGLESPPLREPEPVAIEEDEPA
jgi:hypothetical protein